MRWSKEILQEKFDENDLYSGLRGVLILSGLVDILHP